MNFSPSIREVRDGVWEASTKLPVVGQVSVEAYSWQEAKLSLWLISEAIKLLSMGKPTSEWTKEEWRRTLSKMRELTDDDPRTT